MCTTDQGNRGFVTSLHIVSNFRWTERSEPAADLVLGLCELGVRTQFLCGELTRGSREDSVAFQARRKGLDPIVLQLPKHFRVQAAIRDVPALRHLVQEQDAQVLHTHLPNAQLTAVLACGRRKPGRPLIVHSVYEPDGADIPLRNRLFSLPGTSGWIVISETARDRLTSRYGILPERILVLEPPVDVNRFQNPGLARTDARQTFGLSPDEFIVGLVSRIGLNRGLDLLLKALARIKNDCPQLRALIVGRGEVDGAVSRPAAELGISDRIVLAGYCREDKLVAAYRAMDLFSYMQPGTDKSCRAIREALAAGVPVVGKNTGYIPQLVRENVTGFLFENDPADLARVLLQAYRQRDRLPAMSRNAAADATARFNRKTQAARVLAFYRHLQQISTTTF